MTETFFGYAFAADGMHSGSTRLPTQADVFQYISQNVMWASEIRITDTGDLTVMQIINKELVFPVPEHGKGKRNAWNPDRQRFETRE